MTAGALPQKYFNPRSPCGERLHRFSAIKNVTYFNPRSPCGERRRREAGEIPLTDFNPRSPCGERLVACAEAVRSSCISIHAPRVGSDSSGGDWLNRQEIFQSTLPVWGATTQTQTLKQRQQNFNPRSPCGERPALRRQKLYVVDISIHAPRVGSDISRRTSRTQSDISIHAPRVGSDFF